MAIWKIRQKIFLSVIFILVVETIECWKGFGKVPHSISSALLIWLMIYQKKNHFFSIFLILFMPCLSYRILCVNEPISNVMTMKIIKNHPPYQDT
ncbi:hypothetical protein DNW11_21760 [Salmonella enterica subsp. enterica serovar Jodhpur]|nr:hypothetical protein [Salmonella enterica subsp. enterica serovar Jodhpur]